MELFPSEWEQVPRATPPRPPLQRAAALPARRWAALWAASVLPQPIKARGFLNEAGTHCRGRAQPGTRESGVILPTAVPAAPPRRDEVHRGHRRVSGQEERAEEERQAGRAPVRAGRRPGQGGQGNEWRAAWSLVSQGPDAQVGVLGVGFCPLFGNSAHWKSLPRRHPK